VRPGAPWCTQCYAPAGRAAARPGSASRGRGARRPRAAPQRPAARAPSTGDLAVHACAQPNDLAAPACGGLRHAVPRRVRAARPTVVLPVVGDLLALSPCAASAGRRRGRSPSSWSPRCWPSCSPDAPRAAAAEY
jgi:hypothetical protein